MYIWGVYEVFFESVQGAVVFSSSFRVLHITTSLIEKPAFRVAEDIAVEPVTVAGRAAEWLRAPGANAQRAILYLHGGGYVMGSPKLTDR